MPVVASLITATAISTFGLLQWRVNRANLRVALYKKRLELFEATKKFVQGVGARGNKEPPKDPYFEYLPFLHEAQFFAPREFYQAMFELTERYFSYEEALERLVGINDEEQRRHALDAVREARKGFNSAWEEFFAIAKKYLDMSSLP